MSEELTTDQEGIAHRSANEGIPVGAIARIVQKPFGAIHECLRQAFAVGRISTIPKSDWPPGGKWDTRTPTVPRAYNADDLEFHCRKVFKLTLLEAGFMTALLRYDCANKERLHQVVEGQRMKRQQRPDKLELTDMKIVDVIVCKMRKKLRETDPEVVLTTSWGKGYYFEPAIKDRIFKLIGGIYASGPDYGRGPDTQYSN